jgi:hypothetical protein
MEGVCAYWVWVKILYTIPTILRGKGMDGVCAYWVGVKILYIILTILRERGCGCQEIEMGSMASSRIAQVVFFN